MRPLLLYLCLALAFVTPLSAQTPLADLPPISLDNAAQLQPLARIGRGVVRGFDWSPQGDVLAVASSIGVWLHTLENPEAEPRLLEGQDGASSIAFHPAGALIASGGEDGSVVLWDAASGEERARLINHIYRVAALAFSESGEQLASADASGVARLWDVASGAELATLPGSATPWALAFGSGTIAMSSRAAVEVWDTETGELLARLDLPPAAQTTRVLLAYDAPATIRVALGRDVILWEWAENRVSGVETDGPVLDLRFDDDHLLAATSAGDRVRIWNAAGEVVATIDGAATSIERARLSTDGMRLAVRRVDGDVEVRTTHDDPLALPGYTHPLLRITPADMRATVVDDAGKAVVWDIGRAEALETFAHWAANDPAPAAALSPDGQWLARGGNDGVTRILSRETGELAVSFHGHLRAVTSVAFSQDGALLATGSLDGTTRLWNATTGEALAALEGHTSGVTAVAFGAQGRVLLTTSYDGTLRLWGVANP